MRRVVAIGIGALVLATSCSSSGDSTTATAETTSTTHVAQLEVVEYRAEPIDLANPSFDYLDTAGSSVVDGAWYDADAAYMVIKLNRRFYQYCALPESVWSAFEAATSFGSFYNAQIKGRYGCS